MNEINFVSCFAPTVHVQILKFRFTDGMDGALALAFSHRFFVRLKKCARTTFFITAAEQLHVGGANDTLSVRPHDKYEAFIYSCSSRGTINVRATAQVGVCSRTFSLLYPCALSKEETSRQRGFSRCGQPQQSSYLI